MGNSSNGMTSDVHSKAADVRSTPFGSVTTLMEAAALPALDHTVQSAPVTGKTILESISLSGWEHQANGATAVADIPTAVAALAVPDDATAEVAAPPPKRPRRPPQAPLMPSAAVQTFLAAPAARQGAAHRQRQQEQQQQQHPEQVVAADPEAEQQQQQQEAAAPIFYAKCKVKATGYTRASEPVLVTVKDIVELSNVSITSASQICRCADVTIAPHR